MSESPTREPGTGRRSTVAAKRRVDVLVALGVVLPSVVALCVALIGNESDPVAGPRPPATATLTSATVVCPAGLAADGGSVRAVRAPGVPGGEVAVRTAPFPKGGESDGSTDADTSEGTAVDVPRDSGVVVRDSRGATVLDARGDAAPGLVAGRGDRLAVPECRAPSYDEWLVGVSASARYATTLELVNPDAGDAVVDIELLGATGPVEEPALRGIQVPGHGVKRIDLARAAPRSTSTAAHLTVTRGRVTATARNTWDPLGRGRVSTDFLPADTRPATSSLILGIPAGPVSPTLFLANPGDDEVRVTPQLVTAEAVFTPTGAKEIAVAPRSFKAVRLDAILSDEAAKGTLGIALESTGPVASSIRLLDQQDLVLLAPAPELRDPVAAVVPEGPKSLLLGAATRTGVVHVTSYDAAGKELADKRVEVGPDRAARLALPPRAVSVAIEARNTRIAATVSIPARGRRPGLATLRVLPTELRSRIPVVAPE